MALLPWAEHNIKRQREKKRATNCSQVGRARARKNRRILDHSENFRREQRTRARSFLTAEAIHLNLYERHRDLKTTTAGTQAENSVAVAEPTERSSFTEASDAVSSQRSLVRERSSLNVATYVGTHNLNQARKRWPRRPRRTWLWSLVSTCPSLCWCCWRTGARCSGPHCWSIPRRA